jgi:hypothetical protein
MRLLKFVSWLSILPSLLLSKSFKASKPLAATLPQNLWQLFKISYIEHPKKPSLFLDSSNNAHKQQGNFTTTAGTDNKMNDVWFDVDNFRKVA